MAKANVFGPRLPAGRAYCGGEFAKHRENVCVSGIRRNIRARAVTTKEGNSRESRLIVIIQSLFYFIFFFKENMYMRVI